MIPAFSIDSIEAQAPQIVDRVRRVAHEVGAFNLEMDERVPPGFFGGLFEQISRFFRLPEARKQSVSLANSVNYRGYVGLGSEYTNGVPDLKESFEFAREIEPPVSDNPPEYFRLYGHNYWPEESFVPGFRESLDSYSQTINRVGEILLSGFQVAVGQPVTVDRALGQICSFSRLIYYSSPANYAVTTPRLQTHCDHVLFTTILQDYPGLEIRTNDGQWIRADPIPGTILVFTGELMEFWSRGYYKAVPHRVHNGVLPKERISIASFFLPDLRSTVVPIDRERTAKLGCSGCRVSRDNWWLTNKSEIHDDDGMHPVVVGEREWARMHAIFPTGTGPGGESDRGSA